ncbi:methyltransferase [Paraglaciecola arctica]|uniref:Ribosomal RNA large subunit methyltransferase G n=1 Tax=Paraglaciecola arctica BSs20135 TaxID=493475 RepID=K6XEH4_9ALTE|nr:methyltransferase [Paraglaciecola arctica]GAC19039.1 23S rRNA (guanine1835-N2)-methyltransferase [Paraglaciecola arctica BSs20135]
MNTSLTLLDRNLQLVRYPQNLQHPSWQAWDAADEYLIDYVEQNFPKLTNVSISIYNDDFGALACWFAALKPIWVTDSYVAKQSCLINLQENNISEELVTFHDSVTVIDVKAELVLLKVPKTTALLEQQLIDLQARVSPTTTVIAAGKATLIHKSTLALFEKYLGTTTTSLAKKKARLIFCQPAGNKVHSSPYPSIWYTESPRFEINNLANVFARQQLDIGARFMLEHLSKLPNLENKTVIDLGCGNGVLGLHILNQKQQTKVVFVDESYMAVASAKQNVLANLPEQEEKAEFIVSNCLDDFSKNSSSTEVDLVICNPPFHQQNTITDHIAWQMFKDAQALLKKGGQLFVVGNRHLDYPNKLKRLFGNVTTVATNQKFSILSASKR